MAESQLVDQFGRPVAFVVTPEGMRARVIGEVLPPHLRGPQIYIDPDAQGGLGGELGERNPNSGAPASHPPTSPAALTPTDNGTLGRVYTMPLPPRAPATASDALHSEDGLARPWYERAWEEASKVVSDTLDSWAESANTAWEALPFTADDAATQAARQRIGEGVKGTLEGLGTLMGPPPEFVDYAYMSGNTEAIALVEQMQQNQREAIGAVKDAIKDAWDAAYERNGAAGASAMVLATLGMEAVGGKGAGAVARAGEKVAEIVRLARTPLEAASKLDEAIVAARAAGASAEEIALLTRARNERLAQARREAARGKDGVAVKKGRLAPNSTYEINGYRYTTDAQGRIKTVEGELRLDGAPRSEHAQRTVGVGDGRLPDDQGGHLIGAQFGGHGSYENLTPMHRDINNYHAGEWGRMEKGWADRLQAISLYTSLNLRRAR